MDFADKVVIITGGSSGIGLALAKEFAARQSYVVLAARHQEDLERALASLPSGDRARRSAVSCDVCVPEQVRSLIDQVARTAGLPDILVNCAGVAHPGYVQDLGLEIYEWMMQTNYFGTLNAVKAVLPGMIERGSGVIVNVGSLASYIGLFGYSAYGASKFAVRGFTEALRMEAKPHGIQVCIVLPPDTDTPQLAYENRYKPPELKYLYPEMGVISPEQVARAIIRGIERRKYEIVPDFGSRLILAAYRISGGLGYAVLDLLLKRAQRRIQNENSKQPEAL